VFEQWCAACIGTVLVGVSADEAAHMLTSNARETMRSVTGVDLTSLVFRGKFVFVAQVGSPQKVVMELRDNSLPAGLGMNVLITGRSVKAGANIELQIAPKSAKRFPLFNARMTSDSIILANI